MHKVVHMQKQNPLILPFPIDFDRRPYKTLALPCECMIYYLPHSYSI